VVRVVDGSGHVILYGLPWWSRYMVEELTGEGLNEHRRLVALCDDVGACRTPDIFTIARSGSIGKDLEAAGMEDASAIVVMPEGHLPDETHVSGTGMARKGGGGYHARLSEDDGTSLLVVIEARKRNPRGRIVVLSTSSSSVQFLLDAGADEVLGRDDLEAALSASVLMNEGMATFISEVSSTTFGNEFYTHVVPDETLGMTFTDAIVRVKEERGGLVVAIIRGPDVLVNPGGGTVEEGDAFILLAERQPDWGNDQAVEDHDTTEEEETDREGEE